MNTYGNIKFDDILDRETYRKKRSNLRSDMVAKKRNRRVDVGPFVTAYFENRNTILHQINEMVYIEDSNESQIKEEIEAYRSLIPNGKELVITLMVEIDSPIKRANELIKLGGFEEEVSINIDGTIIRGQPELDMDRTTADGKASSVQFVHFSFTEANINLFKKDGAEIKLEIGHKNYMHSSGLKKEIVNELKGDFID